MKRLYSFALTCMMLLVSAASYATVNVTADPVDGSKLTKLSQVLLTFNDASSVDAGTFNVTITSDGGYNATCAYDYGTEQNQMIVTFDEVSADGVYTITCPAGAFTLDGADSEAFTLSYTIGAGGVDPNVSLIPADGSTVGYLSNIIYCYNTDKSLSAPYPYKKAEIKNEQGEVVATAEYVYKAGLPAGQNNLNLNTVIFTPGTYTVMIQDGTFQYYDSAAGGNVLLPGCTATYIVTGEGMDVVTSDPNMESDVHSAQTITLTFPNETTVKASSTYNYVQIYRDGSTYSVTGVTASNGVVDGNTIAYTLYSPLIEADNYHMMFPAGAFLLGEEERASSPIMVDFRITPAPQVAYTITPDPEGEVKTMQKFTITFPEKTTITKVNSNISASSTVSGFSGGVYTSNNAFAIDGNSVECTMNNVASLAGEYTIKVPTNCFTFDDGTFNTAFEATFTITGSDDVVMEVSPAAEATYSNLQEFIFSFPEATTVELTKGLTGGNIIIKQGNNYITQAYVRSTGSGTFEQVDAKTWKVTMPNKVVLANDYTLHIDANVFTIDGDNYNKETDLSYSVDGTGLDKVTVYPTNLEPIAKLAGPITLTYDNETAVSPATSYTSASLYMVGESYDQFKLSLSSDKFSFEDNVVTVQLKDYQGNDMEYDEPGTYYIKFGTGSGYSNGIFFLSDGETLATPQHIYWTVDPTTTAIKNVNTKTDTNVTYNILGQRVADSQKGLIIRNGKKMFVK